MTFSEKELEDFLYYYLEDSNPNAIDDLQSRGMFVDATESMIFIRQLDLQPYGIADIVGHDIYCVDGTLFANIFIFELKKDKIDYLALGQGYRYLRAFDVQIEEKARELGVEIVKNYKVFLVGTEIDTSSDFCFLPNLIDELQCYTTNFIPSSGIWFKEEKNYIRGKEGQISNYMHDIMNDIENHKTF